MRKENAPPASSKKPAPLEEVHLDLFTYPDDPRYDAFFIDRRTRACWHYVLSKKSDLPAIVQQFVVDVNTLDYPVGSIYCSIESSNKHGIDAKAVNDYLEGRKRSQRLRILYTDGAGESSSNDFEAFLSDLNIQHHMSVSESQHQNALAEHGGGWRLCNMIRHDLDLSGLGPSFRRFLFESELPKDELFAALCTPRPHSRIHPVSGEIAALQILPALRLQGHSAERLSGSENEQARPSRT